MEFRVIVDRESTNPAMSNNGGDYTEGRTFAIDEARGVVAVRYWSSFDGGFCPFCGRYEPFECTCDGRATRRDFEGWQKATVLEGEAAEFVRGQYERGRFASL